MKILCVMFKYEYGDKKRGMSFEYNTFYKFFESQGYDLDLLDFGGVKNNNDKKEFNLKLKKNIYSGKYDLVFCVPFSDIFDKRILGSPNEYKTPFIAWMCDDKWRWEIFSRNICTLFSNVITTDPGAIKKYKSINYDNAILSQWAFNDVPNVTRFKKYFYDVTFVGQINSWRKYVVDRLKQSGIDVKCFGFGWKDGRVDDVEMRNIFAHSKINLNLSNSIKWDIRYLTKINLVVDKNLDIPHRVLNMFPIIHTLFFPKRREDIKARFFEVTGCGGFLLSYYVENLETYFIPDKEIVCYSNIDDLIKKIKYFLKNDIERESIANNGFLRTKTDHLYKNRFNDIFVKIGLK